MRITILAFDFGESVVALASALAKHAEVQLVAPVAEVEPHLEDLDASVRLDAFQKPRLRRTVDQVRLLRQVLGAIRGFAPDVIDLQQGHLWFNTALPLLRDLPLVVTVHDPQHHLGDRASRKTPQTVLDLGFRRADRIITHADANSRVLHRRLGIALERMTAVPLAFPPRPRPSQQAREGPPAVLFFGRIWPYKGLQHLIAAEPAITTSVPAARIVIAGQGEDLDAYRRAMVHPAHFEVHDRYVAVGDRESMFERASVVVLPYVEATQTGVVPLAYRHGKPVVATAVGGLPEVVVDGSTGYLVPPGDPSALAAAVVRLLEPPGHGSQMGRQARELFESLFDPDEIARRTLQVLCAAVADHAAGMRATSRQEGISSAGTVS